MIDDFRRGGRDYQSAIVMGNKMIISSSGSTINRRLTVTNDDCRLHCPLFSEKKYFFFFELKKIKINKKPKISRAVTAFRVALMNGQRIQTSEVELNHVEIGNYHRRFRRGFLVIVEPLAAQTLRLVPNLEQVLVVLDDDCVLVELTVHVRLRAAPVNESSEFRSSRESRESYDCDRSLVRLATAFCSLRSEVTEIRYKNHFLTSRHSKLRSVFIFQYE